MSEDPAPQEAPEITGEVTAPSADAQAPPPAPQLQNEALKPELAQLEAEPTANVAADEVEPPSVVESMNSELAEGVQSPTITSQTPMMAIGTTKKKSKKPFIMLAVIVGVLALLGGGGAFAYNIYQAPENVVLGAISNAFGTKQVRATTTVTSDFTYTSGDTTIAIQKLEFTTGAERTPKMDENATLTLNYNGKTLTLKASVLATDDGSLYFKVDNLKTTVKTLLGDTVTISSTAESYLDNIDGKWAKYTISDIKAANPESGRIAQCTLDAYKKYKDDQKAIQEVVDLYKKQPFVVVKNTVSSKDGNFGYVVDVDTAKSSAFSDSLQSTTIAKAVKACDTSADSSSTSSGQTTDTTNSSDDPTTTVTVWISPWTHELRAIDTVTSGLKLDNDKTYSISSHTDFSFTSGVSTSAPSSTMTFEEWGNNAQAFFMDVVMSSYAETGSSI